MEKLEDYRESLVESGYDALGVNIPYREGRIDLAAFDTANRFAELYFTDRPVPERKVIRDFVEADWNHPEIVFQNGEIEEEPVLIYKEEEYREEVEQLLTSLNVALEKVEKEVLES